MEACTLLFPLIPAIAAKLIVVRLFVFIKYKDIFMCNWFHAMVNYSILETHYNGNFYGLILGHSINLKEQGCDALHFFEDIPAKHFWRVFLSLATQDDTSTFSTWIILRTNVDTCHFWARFNILRHLSWVREGHSLGSLLVVFSLAFIDALVFFLLTITDDVFPFVELSIN